MRVVLQRVKAAKVSVEGRVVGEIEKGLVILLGVQKGDQESDLNWMLDKVINLRIFEDEQGKMNLSLLDIKGSALVVSQFTLLANCKKGRRPSFEQAGDPAAAEKLYLRFGEGLKSWGIKTEKGVFGAKMLVEIANDGPVTIILDSQEKEM